MKSGIKCTSEIKSAFRGFKGGRWMKIQIINEKMKVVDQNRGSSNFRSDFDSMKSSHNAKETAFFIVKPAKGKLCLMLYAPKGCGIQEKFVYSSTMQTLKLGLGEKEFQKTMTTDSLDYQDFDINPERDEFLTETERYYKNYEEVELPKMTSGMGYGNLAKGGKGGMANVLKKNVFPVSEKLEVALKEFKSKNISLCTVMITKEKFFYELKNSIRGSSINLPDDLVQGLGKIKFPRYLLLNVGSDQFLVHYCPTNASVKQKMIYSTQRFSFTKSVLKEKGGITGVTTVETNDLSEITEEYLRSKVRTKSGGGGGARGGGSSSSGGSKGFGGGSRYQFQGFA